MRSTDKYRRDSLDGGTTWGASYQFKGTDGANGSNASVPGYIKSTYIDMTTVETPMIKTNLLKIQAPNNNAANGILLSGFYKDVNYDFLKLSYYNNGSALITISSPGQAIINLGWTDDMINPHGSWNFSNATVTGLAVPAVFG